MRPNEPDSIETAIAQWINGNVKPKKIMRNEKSVVEYLVAKAVRYGYMLAMSQMNIFTTEKKKW